MKGRANKRKATTEPVGGSPLHGNPFLILSVDQDRKSPSTIPTNFIFLIFAVVPPKKKSSLGSPASDGNDGDGIAMERSGNANNGGGDIVENKVGTSI